MLFTFIYIVNHVASREIYTTGKNFTLPPAVTAWTNLNSASLSYVNYLTTLNIMKSGKTVMSTLILKLRYYCGISYLGFFIINAPSHLGDETLDNVAYVVGFT